MLQTNSYNHRDAREESLGNAFWSFGWDIWFKNIKIKIKKKQEEGEEEDDDDDEDGGDDDDDDERDEREGERWADWEHEQRKMLL